jgi:two-component system response regulator HydG|tara:strand:+ start:262 stop:1695 length:1434 start_codon:yes stop_codon:yes gene_type:complete
MPNIIYVSGYQKEFPELLSTGKKIDWVQNGMIAISAVQANPTNIVIIEDSLPLMTPRRLIQELVALQPNLPIISVIRSEERRREIMNDFSLGGFGWFEPGLDHGSKLHNLLDYAINFYQFYQELKPRNQKDMTPVGYRDIVGISTPMTQIYLLLVQIMNKDVTTLLLGESGTGKNLVAHTLHQTGLRRDKPFIHVNCPAIPSELLESELFGHEKGSFTGADDRRDGKFLAANSGTIFLDEIGDMSPSLQAKILRVLESGEIERVGGAETLKVDVRIISATNQDLEAKMQQGSFRQDLYHRINVFPISLPPLRDRLEDIPTTAFSILRSLIKKHNSTVKYISPEGMKLLTEYSWPGNIRELENSLERVVLILDKEILEKEDLLNILKETMEHHQLAKTDPDIPAVNQTEDASPAAAAQPSGNSIDLSEVKTLKELEHKAIVAGLARTNWNLTLTAQQLGISRMTLYRKLDQHDLRQKD